MLAHVRSIIGLVALKGHGHMPIIRIRPAQLVGGCRMDGPKRMYHMLARGGRGQQRGKDANHGLAGIHVKAQLRVQHVFFLAFKDGEGMQNIRNGGGIIIKLGHEITSFKPQRRQKNHARFFCLHIVADNDVISRP